MSYAAVASAVISAAGSAYSANQASKAKKSANAQAQKQQDALTAQLSKSQAASQALRDEQSDPVDVYKEIFLAMPGLLDQTLPAFTRQSTESAQKFSTDNVNIFSGIIDKMFPGYQNQQARRLGILNEMDPANLGAAEIAAVTRKVAPLIPSGTLNPNTGAVSGGTTNPVSLYRNLISGLYQDRRNQFNQQNNAYLADAENTAARQQVRAESFLPTFLGFGQNTAGALTQSTLSQEQQAINAQDAYTNALLGVPTPQANTGQYDQAIAGAVTTGINGLASAYSSYLSKGSQAQSASAAPAQQGNPYSYTTSSGMEVRRALDADTGKPVSYGAYI